MSESSTYIGRFAPSPSGPLHFGSLVAAVASYLDARANDGIWLVRMEDLDPAREPKGTDKLILSQLDEFELQSDSPVLYQSSRHDAYREALGMLQDKQLTYACDCSRQQIKLMGSVYKGICRTRLEPPSGEFAIRIKTNDTLIQFDDLVQGTIAHSLFKETGDFVLKRKDGHHAYQLAVVVDDAFQKVTHVIRGFDLLESTPRQIYLQQQLGYPTPIYGHVPIAVNELGQKLSKQHFAEPIEVGKKRELLHTSLEFLGLHPHSKNKTLNIRLQLQWAIEHWDIHKVPKLANIPLQSSISRE